MHRVGTPMRSADTKTPWKRIATGTEKLQDRVKPSNTAKIPGKARHQSPIVTSRAAKPRRGFLIRVLSFPQRKYPADSPPRNVPRIMAVAMLSAPRIRLRYFCQVT
jgi:hypothetical protein